VHAKFRCGNVSGKHMRQCGVDRSTLQKITFYRCRMGEWVLIPSLSGSIPASNSCAIVNIATNVWVCKIPVQLLTRRVADLLRPCRNSVAQAVIHRPPTAAVQILAQIRSYGICDEQSGTGVGFHQILLFPCQ
jgi:hypothetical protein